jgi:anti-sigma B factor antagonist
MTDQCSPSTSGVVEDFELRTRRCATGVVLEVVGEVDGFTAPLLLDAARSEFEVGARTLVLDLAGVGFCSVRCLGTLIEIRRLAEGSGATVRIVRPSDKVRRTAELVDAHDVIDSPAPPGALRGPTPGGQAADRSRTPPPGAAAAITRLTNLSGQYI